MPRNRKQYLVREKNRHGKWVWYVRVSRQAPRVRIRAEFGSPEFDTQVDAAIAGTAKPTSSAKPHKGSLRWLADKWRESSDWHGTAPSTKRQRDNILVHILAANGDKPFALITDDDILAGRERRMKTPFAANNFLKTMRAMFGWAKSVKLVKVNPAAEVPMLPRATEGHEPWTDEDVAAYRARWPLGSRERVAMELLYWTGLRRGDVVRLGKQHVGRDGMATIKAEKTGVTLYVTMLQPLLDVLEAGPVGDLSFIVGEGGNPLTKESFGTWFRQACNAASVKKSAHGLRKLAATTIADRGGSEIQLQAQFGWVTNDQSSAYTRNANRAKAARLAAEKLLPNNSIPAPSTQIPAPKKRKAKSNG